ncbi:calcium-binding protein [Salipiger sp. HF18]|uniref:calcium-binding protein n=1 Tax=Salipiger sp. HF18 TaxID=2721557 RepID=UPI00142E9047|nr:calcium-binding protein [Salipiger sp. HF18]NIY95196.1 calcium-binding protein [Salipiger sp. HF18]
MTEWRATHIDGRVGGLGAIPPEIQFDPVTGRLYLHAGAGQARDAFALGGNGLLRFLTAQADGTAAVDLAARGMVLRLDAAQVDRVESAAGAGSAGTGGVTFGHSTDLYAGQSGLAADLAHLLATGAGGTRYFIAALHGSPGLSVLTRDAGGDLTELRYQGDRDIAYLSDPVAMVSVETAEGTLVLATSSSEAGLSSFTLRPDGRLVLRDSIGAADGVGINTPTALAVAEVGGKVMALLGAAGTGTISVFEVAGSGALRHVGQALDDRGSFFQGLSVLRTATLDGTVYVVAGGSDDGLTLFSLLPDGHLVELQSLADSTALGLDNVNALELVAAEGVLHAFVTSETGTGVTHLSWAPDPDDGQHLGGDRSEALSAGAGDDLLFDGAGSDTLTGGTGADLFVFAADGSRDVITDFTPGQDMVDLSGWDWLYSTAQLEITATATGAEIRYGDELLELRTADGRSLGYDDFMETDMLGLPRVPRPVVTTAGLPSTERTGGDGADVLDGTIGHDRLSGSGGNDTIFGNTGVDEVHGGLGDDWISPGDGVDIVHGDGGNDTVIGRTGWDTLWGDDGHDHLYGSEGQDDLHGGDGNDYLSGGFGYDFLWGDAGDDSLYGNLGNDSLDGGAGNDALYGATGNDTLRGGAGHDTLYSSQGVDELEGGAGDDLLFGGSLVDSFHFAPGHGHDVIGDFEAHDRLCLDAALVGGATSAAEVVARFGSIRDGMAVLDFGDSEIVFQTVTDLDLLVHSIVLV